MKGLIHICRFAAFVTALLINVSESFSQLQVTANSNAGALASILGGQGVAISGATMNCPVNASGTFNGAASNLGIAAGVLLTSGDVVNALGPNTVEAQGTSNNVNFSDPSLTAIEPQATYDPCILEFDAVPSCSTLVFTFSFASEEYPEYVNNGPFNDIFGIFVTGPNPSGPAYAGYNMALIPSTTTPVAINTVNNGYSAACPGPGPGTNGNYFVENCQGATIQYDGFTRPITVTLNVSPCSTYHFKLAIADAGDHSYDSGVFFSMKSLACNPLPILVATTSTPSNCTANNGTASATPTGGTAPYTYSWSTTPVQVTQTATGLTPGTYTVSVFDVTGCFFNTGTVTVGATGGFPTTETHTDVTCFGINNGSATVTPTGGTAPYSFSWSTTPVQTGATISNIPAGTYTCTVIDATGCIQTQTVTIVQPPAFTATVTNTIHVSCPTGSDGSATASGSGGVSPYNYVWNTTPPQAGPVASNLTAGNYVVTITDANSCTVTRSVTITQPMPMNLPTSATTASCGMTDGTATVNPSGGVAPYTYLWLTAPAVQTTPTASNLGAGTYTVIVTDSKGCLQNKSVVVPGGAPPDANFYFSPSVVSLLDPIVIFQDASGGIIASYIWNFGDIGSGVNDTSGLQNPLHTYSDTGRYCITLIVRNPSGLCSDTIVKCLIVEAPSTFYIPNTFTPNNDGYNDLFMGYGTYIKEFHMDIYDRWGNHIFESNDIYKGWNGAVENNGSVVQEDVYVWKVKVIDTNNDEHTYIGHVNLIK